jgi:formate hydrogenlyase subunit 6/NADH:ubiquinone oxidoreductase subunit I
MDTMRKRHSLFNAILDAVINRPDTVAYPFGALELPEGYRGAIVINPDLCTGCGLCVRDCPTGALKLEKKSRDEFKLIHYPARCAYCSQCESSCVRRAIRHSNALVRATADPQELVVVLKEKTEDEG